MKMRIIKSLVVIVAAVTVATGATYASFSAQATASGTFVSGWVNLSLSTGQGSTSPFTISNIYPGWSQTVNYTVQNTGSLDGYLTFNSLNVTDDRQGTDPNNSASRGYLSTVLMVRSISINGGAQIPVNQPLVSFRSADLSNYTSPKLVKEGTQSIAITLDLPSGTGNQFQNASVTGSLNVTLNAYTDQTNDSNDSQY
jgi:predicted ribosomally synthesized peptide with SipW-like signal peptide